MKKFYTIAIMVSGLLLQLQGGSFAEYKASCGKGNMQDCYHLGMAYSKGDGVRKNLKNARLFLKFSCDSGIDEACVSLRRMKDEGVAANVNMEQLDGKLQGDIDRDGKLEMVAWRKTSTTDFADYYQLLVFDDDGALLWKSPQSEDTSTFLFFTSDVGNSMPQILIDIGKSGKAILLAPVAQSDVAPVFYRIFSWTGSSFKLLAKYALILDKKGDRFIWKAKTGSYGVWIDALSYMDSGQIKASVMGNSSQGVASSGEVIVTLDQKGAIVKQIVKPLKKIHYGD